MTGYWLQAYGHTTPMAFSASLQVAAWLFILIFIPETRELAIQKAPEKGIAHKEAVMYPKDAGPHAGVTKGSGSGSQSVEQSGKGAESSHKAPLCSSAILLKAARIFLQVS